MATEKKLKDPAEAALSAIEQALNLDALTPTGTDGRAEPRLPDVGDAEPLLDGGLDAAGRTMPPRLDLDPPLASDLPPPGLDRPRREGGLLPPDRSLVANDDRRNIGILQQTLRVRSSPKPYLFALAAGARLDRRPGADRVARNPTATCAASSRGSPPCRRASAQRPCSARWCCS